MQIKKEAAAYDFILEDRHRKGEGVRLSDKSVQLRRALLYN